MNAVLIKAKLIEVNLAESLQLFRADYCFWESMVYEYNHSQNNVSAALEPPRSVENYALHQTSVISRGELPTVCATQIISNTA